LIDINSMKDKILEFAIIGKLSEQCIEDGNAEELYNKLTSERKRLVNNKIIKNKEFEPILEDKGLFEIPNNWKWIRLGEISSIISKGTTPRGGNVAYTDSGIGFLRAENLVGYDRIDCSNMKYVDEDTHLGFLKRSILEDGDVLISIAGTLGRTGLVRSDNLPLNINQAIAFIRFASKEAINVEYVSYILNAPTIQKELGNKKVDMAIPNLSLDVIANSMIPLPTLAEQKRIVEKIRNSFECLDKIDELQTQYASDIDVLKSKLIDAGIRGKLTEQLPEDGTAEELYVSVTEEKKQIVKDRKGREDKNIKELDDEVPYELPTNWKWVRFGEIGLFKKGPFGSALTKAMFVPKSDDTVKVYEQQHAIQKNSELGIYYITREYFDDKMSGFEVLPGDIIVSCAGTIGETYILPDEIEQGIINQALMRVSLVPSVNKRFFQYYFDANLKKTAQEESNGSAIKNIPPFDVMKNWYFPLAPLKEQERIVDKIDELLSLM